MPVHKKNKAPTAKEKAAAAAGKKRAKVAGGAVDVSADADEATIGDHCGICSIEMLADCSNWGEVGKTENISADNFIL